MILYQLIKHCMAFYYDHINISIIYLACWGLETRYKDNIRRGMGSLYFLPKWWHYTVRSTCFLPLSFLFYALFIIIKGGVCLTALEVNWFIQIFYINYFLRPFSPLMGKTKINGIVWILLQRMSFIFSLYLILVGNTYIILISSHINMNRYINKIIPFYSKFVIFWYYFKHYFVILTRFDGLYFLIYTSHICNVFI